ncbi:CBS domain-containing protein [Lapidilactobacillus bayanensis]|uniref:CBS domain-containing protein n=1 Tax=Lapidilactobacillus bayanensis TaxID=2485998 RepID=UPI000F7AB34E|nr:CBS domain-containing protein [Lapidilactobacillus bayanensis]
MDNYQRFLQVFNELERVIQHRLQVDAKNNLGALLRIAQQAHDQLITSHYQELDFLRNFRNILVHEGIQAEGEIATPSDYLIEKVETLTTKIREAKKIKALFRSQVISFKLTDNLHDVLQAVKKYGYTKFPVFAEDHLVGVVTDNGITKFMASQLQEDLISIKSVHLENILALDKRKDSFMVVNEETSIYDIDDIFMRKIKEGKSSFILLMSSDNHVDHPDDITGIITPWDMPEIIANL